MKVRKKRLAMVLGGVLFIGIVIVGFVLYNLPDIRFQNEKEIVAIHEEIQPEKFIKKVKGNIEDVTIDSSQVDTSHVGQYQIIYRINDEEYILKVEVVDKNAPVVSLKKLDIDLGMEVKAEDCIEKIEDETQTTVKFVEEYDFTKEGVQEVDVVVEDESHNKTTQTTQVSIVKDTEKPTIKGLKDIESAVGAKINYTNGLTAVDNRDPQPKITVDSSQVNTSKVGTYTVTYTVEDRSHNKNTYKKQVSIVKKRVTQSIAADGSKVVYLTFDDGPSNQTKRILDILDKYNAKATFFVTGQNAKYRYLIKEASQRGHTIGLHTYSHTYSKVYASVDAYFNDLNRVGNVVKAQIGYVPRYIRFPGGSSNTISRRYTPGIMTTLTREVQNRGYQYYDWNADTTDASGNNVAVSRLIANGTSSRAKNIMILAHDTASKATTADALPAIIEHYQKLGYTFKGIDDSTFTPHQRVNN